MAGNRDRGWRGRHGAVVTAGDEELGAADVELRIRRVLELVLHAQQLRTSQIVSSREIGRERRGDAAVVVVHLFCGPFLRHRVVGLLADLEPAVTGGAVARGRVGDLLEIDGVGAFVRGVDGGCVRV